MQVNEIWPDWHGNSDTFSLAWLCSCIDYLLLIVCILQMMFPSASSFPPYNKHFKADNCNETRVLSSTGVSCYLSPPLLSQFCSLCSTPYTSVASLILMVMWSGFPKICLMYVFIQQSCILEFDGASKGNPGLSGAGAVLRAEDRSVVCAVHEKKNCDSFRIYIFL